MLLNYSVCCVCVLNILYVSNVLLVFVHCIQYLARISDFSTLIDKLDDDVNVYSTDSTTGASASPGTVIVVSTVSSSCWGPFPDLLLDICLIDYYFKCQLILCLIFLLGYFLKQLT